ncbi:MAG: hypothetical protein ACE5GM_01835 [bacterium]
MSKIGPVLTNYLKSIWFIKLLLTFAIAGALIVGYFFMEKPVSDRFTDYRIELLSVHTYENKDDLMVTEGTIQSVSSEPLENVKAVVSWYDRKNNFILTGERLIAQELLRHYETSTFRLTIKKEPGMDKYRLAFRSGKKLISLVYSRPYKSVFGDK